MLHVNVGSGITEEFATDIGVRQGDNLSPILFNIYCNIGKIFSSSKMKLLDLFYDYYEIK